MKKKAILQAIHTKNIGLTSNDKEAQRLTHKKHTLSGPNTLLAHSVLLRKRAKAAKQL